MTIDEKKKLHAQLAFVHQVLTQRTQYFSEEFAIAKDAIATVTLQANTVSDEIRADEAPVVNNEAE